MELEEAFYRIRKIEIQDGAPDVLHTVIQEIIRLPMDASWNAVEELSTSKGIFTIAVLNGTPKKGFIPGLPESLPERFIYLKLDGTGTGCLVVSHPYYLYGFVQYLFSDLFQEDAGLYKNGRIFEPAFKNHRVAYDYFLTQEGRITQNLDRETYMKELARNGFTHVEVNGLGSPMGIETGPKGEVYPMFYTYCPALDQFVYSSLNKGIYPFYYLSANLNYLKQGGAKVCGRRHRFHFEGIG
jgi:hypothetical protein